MFTNFEGWPIKFCKDFWIRLGLRDFGQVWGFWREVRREEGERSGSGEGDRGLPLVRRRRAGCRSGRGCRRRGCESWAPQVRAESSFFLKLQDSGAVTERRATSEAGCANRVPHVVVRAWPATVAGRRVSGRLREPRGERILAPGRSKQIRVEQQDVRAGTRC